MTALWQRGRTALARGCGFATLVVLLAVAAPALALETIPVALDEARVIKLPERAATVVLGNPLVADIAIQAGGIAVITAKGYGATNLIAMDARGAVLMEKSLVVTGPSDRTVVVFRGMTRETYSCTPYCSPRLTLGDDVEFFTKTITELQGRNNAAMGMGLVAPH
jgi:hypothetical protein